MDYPFEDLKKAVKTNGAQHVKYTWDFSDLYLIKYSNMKEVGEKGTSIGNTDRYPNLKQPKQIDTCYKTHWGKNARCDGL